jgi:chemotaxis protein methyltransferase CheR
MPETSLYTPEELSRFCELIHDRCGLDFPSSRLADLELVIADTLGITGLPNVDALLALFANGIQGEAVFQEMIADLTVNETYFFRNQPQFHALEHHILPELIGRRRASRQLRIWSAGCATGEEPYSLAILLERLLPDLSDWNIHLLATDINPDVLAKGQQGRYGEWSFRHVPEEIKGAYFTSLGTEFEIKPRLRSRVCFARLNLADDAFPSFFTQTNNMDLILCRNVLIYFRSETVRRIVGHFHRALAEDGWLIVGHAEPSQATFGQFATRNFPGTVVYQKAGGTNTGPESKSHAYDSPKPLANGSGSDRLRSTARVERPPVRHKPPTEERSPYQKAKELADKRQWEEAENWIAIALGQDPLSAPAHYLHGLILMEKAQPAAALAALRSCLFADAEFVLGHMAFGELLAQQGHTERARKALDTVARLAAGRPAHELIPEGDGLTAGGLLAIVHRRKQQT